MSDSDSPPDAGDVLRALIHEVRTPIQTLVNLAEDGLADTSRDRLERRLTQLRRDTLRLMAAVDDASLRDDLASGALLLDLQDFALADLLADVGESIEAFEPDRLELAYDPDLIVRADPILTRRLVWFLVVNALRATPESADPVWLDARRGNGRVELRVRDHGPAIPEEMGAQLFEPRARLSGTVSWPRYGLGRGLVSGRDVARRMNGDLALESGGEGNVFVLALPDGECAS